MPRRVNARASGGLGAVPPIGSPHARLHSTPPATAVFPGAHAMTLDQVLAFGLIGITVAAFIWDRLPYDLIALTALAAGIALGLVPAEKAFSGFSDDIVIIVGAALVLSTAIARSGAVETLMRPILPHLTSAQTAGHRPRGRGPAPLHGHEERRRAGDLHAHRPATRPPHRHIAFHAPDADGVRVPDRRHRHPGGHIAQRHRLQGPGRSDRAAFRHVRLRAGRAVRGGCRLPLPVPGLAAAATPRQRGTRHGRRVQPRTLHHRGKPAGRSSGDRRHPRGA